jgi:hypothetical protein
MAVPEFYLVISYKLQRQTCLDFLWLSKLLKTAICVRIMQGQPG